MARQSTPGRAQRRPVESRRMPGYNGREACQNGQEACTGRSTRHYGEMLPGNAFTGWRGPYCSAACYRSTYPAEDGE